MCWPNCFREKFWNKCSVSAFIRTPTDEPSANCVCMAHSSRGCNEADMKNQNALKLFALLSLVCVISALALSACKSTDEHPKGKSEHPTSEHPKTNAPPQNP